MASEEPVMLESYVVDAGRKCKIRCCSRDHVILFVQAVKMFSGDTFWMGEDKLVAYGTGDELTSDCAFRKHRYYMYLKKGEVFTDDPKFDVKVMACQNPPGRPLPLVNYLFKEQAVGIYRDLIVNKKYLQNGYLEAIEIPKLQLMAPIWSDILFKAMKRSIPEMPVKEVIMAADEIATMASNRLPSSGSWQDLKDHMREAGDVCYADVNKDGTGSVEFLRYEDMKYACKKLDDTKFRSHEGESAYIRVKAAESEGGSSGKARSRSRSRSGGSPAKSRSRSPVARAGDKASPEGDKDGSERGTKREHSASRSRSRSSHSKSKSPSHKSKSKSKTPASRSASPEQE